MHVSEMLDTSPAKSVISTDALVKCIEACFDCAQACDACADACLAEQHIDMLRRCIRLNQDCADICIASGRMLSRQQGADARVLHAQLEACRAACQVCGDECSTHASKHEHCRICADACRTCAKACHDALGAFGPTASASMKH